jgi:predicted nucleic-acid-binding Zn-ribbon protein
MSRFFDAVKAGVRGAMSQVGAGHFRAAGRPITCRHCGEGVFQRREAQLNTAGSSALGLDWLDKSAVALVCVNCGMIELFGKEPERV